MQLNFFKDYVLEDSYVKICPLEEEHVLDLEQLSRDADIWTYFLEKGQGGGAFHSYISNAFQQKQARKEYPFVIFDKEKDCIAGMTRFYEYSPVLQSIKLGHSWYGKDFRGTGINKHCKYLLFQFAFEELYLERIGFGAYASNHVSIAAMKSVGCTQEGVLRNLFPSLTGIGRTDCVLYSILREEWLQVAESTLRKKLRKP